MEFEAMSQVENAETPNPELCRKCWKDFDFLTWSFTEHFTFLTIPTE